MVGQEAAGDSLGLSTAGVDGLDSGLVVDTAGVDDAPGLLHAAIAPTSARANRILLIMDFSSDCVPRADEPAVNCVRRQGSAAMTRRRRVLTLRTGRKRPDCIRVAFRLQSYHSR